MYKLMALTSILVVLGVSSLAQPHNPPLILNNHTLKSVAVHGSITIDTQKLAPFISSGHYFTIFHFYKVPGASTLQSLHAKGIDLKEYIGSHAWYVSVPLSTKNINLESIGSDGAYDLTPETKLQHSLAQELAEKPWNNANIELNIIFSKDVDALTAKKEISKYCTITSDEREQYQILHVSIPVSHLMQLAEIPFLIYLEKYQPAQPLLEITTPQYHHANVLKAPSNIGGHNLSGKDVLIGIGDDGSSIFHVDMIDRMLNLSVATSDHGTGVTGAAAGNGLRDPMYPGLAPASTVINEFSSNILALTPHHYKTYNMVLTNNSYGLATSDQQTCGQNGSYDADSRYLDQLALDYPEVLHVFAAGNVPRVFQCGALPANYGTLARGMNVSKNIVTVGGSDENSNISYFSKGPTLDHRLKPELLATSVNVYTITGFDIYQRTSGTSYASPQVAGTAALLYERYRQLNGGKNPKAALIKAALCNGGTDKGNKGPDYAWGFGLLNALQAVKIIEDKSYFYDSAANGEMKSFAVNVPSNSQQLKVTLYWADQPGNPLSAQSLVNDLDLSVVSGGQTILPQLLDTSIAGLTLPAHTGVDHINNIEQVVIDNPSTGNYTIQVKGFDVPAGRQDFFVVYEAVPHSLQLYFPFGGEKILPNSLQTMEWEAPGFTSAPCSLDISTDGGLTWTSLKQSDISKQKDTVSIPNIPTIQARMRISSGGNESVSANFTILDRPVLPLTVYSPCESYLQPSWLRIPGADSFRIYLKQGKDMVPVGTTTDTFFLLKGLSKDTAYWVAAAAIMHGSEGMRAYAQQGTPNGTTCSIPEVDNDLSLDSVVAPLSGRKNTSTELSNHETIKIRIKNLDDQPSVGPVDVGYQINGGPVFTETINVNIPAQGTYDYSFSAPYDFSIPGTYQIRATVNKASDNSPGNNQHVNLINVVKNDPVIIPLTDDLSKAADTVYIFPTVGLKGIERWDIRNSDANGRINTRIDDGTGHLLGGIVVNGHQSSLTSGQSTVAGTFNLQGHNTQEDLRFSATFRGSLVGGPLLAVRGSDTSAWIQVPTNHFRRTSSSFDDIELSNVLDSVGQSLSSSAQFRMQLRYNTPYYGFVDGRGIMLDTVKLFAAKNDIQVTSVSIPSGNYCQGTAVPVTVTLRNTVSTVQNNVALYCKAPNGQVFMETIPSLGPRAILNYTFQQKAVLQGNSPDSLIAWVAVPNDSYRNNDTAISSSMSASPYAQQYPYFESFENGPGYIKSYQAGGVFPWLYSNGGRTAYSSPTGNVVVKPANGLAFWYIVPRYPYSIKGIEYLESSCLDLSSFAHPYFSFSLARDLRPGRDSLWMEYSADDGNNWQRLIGSGITTNWYSGGKNYWSDSAQFIYHAVSTALPATPNGKIKLRIAAATDSGTNRSGVMFDDFHVYDNQYPISINNSSGTAAAKQQGWTDIISGGQLIASVLAGNNDLGSIKAQVFTNTGQARVYENRYLLGRNWVISSDRPAREPVKVRLYFTDQEAQSLLNALHCSTCQDTLSAYDFGAYVNYGPAATWNNKLSDNIEDLANYIIPDSILLVPFDKGYYAEFSTTRLGEFWLNNGFALNSNNSFSFLSFTANELPSSNDVQLNWSVQGEQNLARYEVQWAVSKEAMDSGLFAAITSLAAINNPGQQNYNYLHSGFQKSGTIYYRIRAVMQNNTSVYSDLRVISFDKKLFTILYPNPAQSNTVLLYLQAAFPAPMQLKVFDISGRMIFRKDWQNNVYTSVQQISLPASMAPGIYMVEIVSGNQRELKKLLKF